MTVRIAISGHRGLPWSTGRLVRTAISTALAEHAPDVIGITCLAEGADQIFARAVTDLGGQLEVVIPAADYRDVMPVSGRLLYDELITRASSVRRLPFTQSTSAAYMAASQLMIGLADELYAVWNGLPAQGYGGTADVVTYARERGLPVRVIWPIPSRREFVSTHERRRRIHQRQEKARARAKARNIVVSSGWKVQGR